ncbi:transcription elongation factor [Salegentibacter sediminis]|uniref:transcription elongation factor n=1 Tax=Salegentibacter sediminis TaxID=1930251 RepID=UPI0009C0AA37|nr:transcription elongation factor [Salegentibacter sediminis]
MAINKKEIYYKSLEAVNRRIEKYEKEMDMIKESMEANDVKTDYDEDNKGQLLGDFEKYAEYLNQAQEMKEKLAAIDLDHYSETVNFGSVVETDKDLYFVAVPIGEIELEDGSKVFSISTEAPIYELMKDKKAGDRFSFKEKEREIKKVH